MEYLQLFEEFYNEKIRYLLCGGLAVNLYGVPRSTGDIDLLIDFEEQNVKGFLRVLEKFHYNPLPPISILTLIDEASRKNIIEQKNMVAYSYNNNSSRLMTVDVLIKFPLSFSELWQRKEIKKWDDYDVLLVSIQDLIAMKEYSNRKQDKDDIISLSKFLKQ